MTEIEIYYRIDRKKYAAREQWEPLPGKYASEDEARLQFADSKRFPIPSGLRVVKVVEEEVFR